MLTQTLTRRARYRFHKPLFKKPVVILQVEVHAQGYYMDPHPMGGSIDVDRKFWRDASPEDITTMEALK